MTLEIIIFIAAILFGIVIYWTESKSNKVYRFINRLTHNDELQMTADNPKGFFHMQPFLMRLVYVTLFFVIAALFIQFVTPFSGFFAQMFASAIVGTLIGTYIASVFLFARNTTSKENIGNLFDKGKAAVEEFTEDIKDNFETKEQPSQESTITKEKEAPKKSARDRLRDKGMIK
jgi:Na+/H+ antiporter NhaC